MKTLASRAEELRAEYTRGRAELAELQARERALIPALSRIEGAIHLLEELMRDSKPSRDSSGASPDLASTDPTSAPGAVPSPG